MKSIIGKFISLVCAVLAAQTLFAAAVDEDPVKGDRDGASFAISKEYEYKENAQRVKSVKLESVRDGWDVVYTDSNGEHRFAAGYGMWKHTEMDFSNLADGNLSGIGGRQPIAASAAWTNPDTFTCKILVIKTNKKVIIELKFTPATVMVTVSRDGNTTTLTGVKK